MWAKANALHITLFSSLQISAVRAIVPNRSNNEIVLVLQHFDNCVDKTVQAFMEGNSWRGWWLCNSYVPRSWTYFRSSNSVCAERACVASQNVQVQTLSANITKG